jgi:hypothetical protein
MRMKTCKKCHALLEEDCFSKDSHNKTDGLRNVCKSCSNLYQKEYSKTHLVEKRKYMLNYMHQTGRSRPMRDAKDCAPYLGHVSEVALSGVFSRVEMMPYGNPGYDFLCSNGYKIDVKSGCLRIPKGNRRINQYWGFAIRKNIVADYFLLLAFGDRDTLTPLHVWLVPGEVINKKMHVFVTDDVDSIARWAPYERPIDRVLCACDKMKMENAL